MPVNFLIDEDVKFQLENEIEQPSTRVELKQKQKQGNQVKQGQSLFLCRVCDCRNSLQHKSSRL